MITARMHFDESNILFPLLIIYSLPAIISGTGGINEVVSSSSYPENYVSDGADNNISKINQSTTLSSIQEHESDDRLPKEVDHFFLLIMSIIIFFMQCGFAFMEAGAVRSKNTVNILIKNWLDMCIGALVYWAVGFGLTFGNSPPLLAPFMGSSYFFFFNMPAYKLSKWFFQFVFAATAATLVSGSLAERCNFIAYLVYSIMITGFIYPIIAHWTWHKEGWLRINGFHDFAGSAVVHTTGAVCALVGCVLMGPRHGRFDKTDGHPIAMPGHSVPLSALGGLILVFGFFACNGTKRGSITNPGDGLAVATAIVNTALGTSAAGLCTLMFSKTGIVPGTGRNYSFLITMNGSLTGTIALCAGCNVYPAWASVIVGGLSGPIFVFCNYIMIRCGIDDPLDAIPVHGAGGIFGTIAVYIFKAEGGLITGGFLSKEGRADTNYPFDALNGLAWNVIGLIAIIAWTGVTCFIMFSILAKLKMLRVETEQEFKGMDLLKHGESAYPADAWVEQQYMKEDAIDNGLITGCENGTKDGKHQRKSSSASKGGLPPHMSFNRAASYNNPHEMFPSTAKLFSGFNCVAANVASTRNILLKPVEDKAAMDLEVLTDHENKEHESINSNKLSAPEEAGIPLRVTGLTSNGLDGDLVLHNAENKYNKNKIKFGQHPSQEDSIEEEDESHSLENTTPIGVDHLTKSSTTMTHLSAVAEEDNDMPSTNQDMDNDDGIVIEEEHLNSNHGNTNKKTTSITLTTKAQSAIKSNQYQNQETSYNSQTQFSSNAPMENPNSNLSFESKGQRIDQSIVTMQRSSLPMPMVIAAANKARSGQKGATSSSVDTYPEGIFCKNHSNSQTANQDKNKNQPHLKVLKVAVVTTSNQSTVKSSPEKRNTNTYIKHI